MNDQIKTTRTTGIILPTVTMDHLDQMAQDDIRDRSAEITFLVNQEWERRQALKSPTTPSQRSKARIPQEA